MSPADLTPGALFPPNWPLSRYAPRQQGAERRHSQQWAMWGRKAAFPAEDGKDIRTFKKLTALSPRSIWPTSGSRGSGASRAAVP